MEEYTEDKRHEDYSYFKEINAFLYERIGHKFIAIRNRVILETSDDIVELIKSMNKKGYEMGTYLAQEINGIEDCINTRFFS